MKPTFTPLAIKNAGLALEEALPQVFRGKPQLADFLFVCTCFRQLAAGSLLVSGDARPFLTYLFKSSRAFVHFLQKAAPDEKLTSKSEPFFDAVSCRDDEGATLMARHARATCAQGREYEEDFYYPRFLMDRFFLKAPEALLQRRLDEWAALGGEEPVLPLCQALLGQDQRAFDGALKEAIDARAADLRERSKGGLMGPDEAATTAHVSTEVLAWIELGQRAGFEVDDEQRLAPGLARNFKRAQHPAPDAWKDVALFHSLEDPDRP